MMVNISWFVAQGHLNWRRAPVHCPAARQVPPPCRPSTLGGDCSNDDGDDDGGGDDDDYDGDDDDDEDDDADDDDDNDDEEEEGCHMWCFSV